MPLKSALLRDFGGCCFAVTLLKVAFMVIRGDLYKYGINLNSRITHYLNERGKKTKPSTLDMLTDEEVIDALRTIVSLCRESGVEIGDLLKNTKSDLII